jgi:hypothetical protein
MALIQQGSLQGLLQKVNLIPLSHKDGQSFGLLSCEMLPADCLDALMRLGSSLWFALDYPAISEKGSLPGARKTPATILSLLCSMDSERGLELENLTAL